MLAMYRCSLARLLAAIAVLSCSGPAFAQNAEALPEMTLGAADAPVTIIEYASMSCPHCASFHANVYPELKERYIDTRRVRFIFREFPLNAPAFQASVLARCGGPSRYFGFIDILFRELQTWAAGPDPLAELAQIGLLGGISTEEFQACLQDKRITDGILENRLIGEQEHGISSTPSFVINGRLLTGAQEFAHFEQIIEPLLEGRTPAASATSGPVSQVSSTGPTDSGSDVPTWIIIVIVAATALALGVWFAIRRRSTAASP